MVLPSDATLRLIKWLAALDHEALLHLAQRRNLKVGDLQSLTTLALALADDANIQATLAALPRQDLVSLARLAAGESATGGFGEAARLGFVDDESGEPRLLCRVDQLSSVSLLEAAPPTLSASDTAWDEAALARAGTYVETLLCVIDDLLGYIAHWPVPVNKDGLLSVSSHKALAETLGDALDLALLTKFLVTAHVLDRQGNTVVHTRASVWSSMSRVNQWESLAGAWWGTLPPWIHQLCQENPHLNWGVDLPAQIAYHYPLLGQRADLQAVTTEAHLLGLLHEGKPTPWGVAIFSGSAVETLSPYLPEPVKGVYANEDFTFLAPGPLSMEHRAILDRFTHKEHGGLVPRYRLSSATIITALQAGEAESDIVEKLQSTAQNPLPQGMVHLVQDTIRLAHNIQLFGAERGTHVRVVSNQLAQELLADPALSALTMALRGDTELTTTWPIERVHSALASAKYVALIADKPAKPPAISLTPETPQPLVAAVEKLAHSMKGAKAQGIAPWLGSMIEVATENKIPLEIDCEMPGGAITTLVMEPRSLSNGRLRGLELKNAMEKTIPVSSIKRIIPFVGGVDAQ